MRVGSIPDQVSRTTSALKIARHDSSDSEDDADEDAEVNLLAMQMQRYQYQSVPTFTELWTIWSLVDSTCYDINGRDNLGVPPIVYAAKRGSVILLRLLLNYHADINAMSSIRETAVMAACRKQKHNAVHLLIKRGARLDLIDRSQFSALRWASTHGDVSLVRLLLKHNVSVTSDCYTANSALEIAMAQPTKKHAKIALLLQRQLVMERRQLLQDVIKQKERAEIAEIKKHRRRMRRLARKEKELQETAGSDLPVATPSKPKERSPFSLPIVPSLKKKLSDPHDESAQGGGDDQGGRSASYKGPPTTSAPHKMALQHALRRQFSPPAVMWVRAGQGQWRQVEIHQANQLPVAATMVTADADAMPGGVEERVHQLIKSESKFTAFLHETPSRIKNGEARIGDGVDMTAWHIEDLE